MLQNIRDRLTGPTALIILGLIAVPFVFVGVGAPLLRAGFAAKVDGEEISLARFESAWQNQVGQNPEILNYPQFYQAQVRQQILDQLILEKLVSNYIDDAGLRVSDSMVTDLIQQVPAYQEDGVFSLQKFKSTLALEGRNSDEFYATVKQSLRRLQLQQSIASTAFVTPAEYRRYLNLFGESRQVAIATLGVEGIRDAIEISDVEIQEFYDAQPNEFYSDESLDLNYIEVRRDELAQNAAISDEEVQRYYEESSNRYLQDEQRRASHILIPFGDDENAASELATSLAARAEAGEPFEDLARTYSKDGATAKNGGDLGEILHSQMPDALGDAIFSMRKSEIRGPVRSDFGFHVVRLEDIVAGGPLPLDQVRSELERELRDRAAELEYRKIETALSNAIFDSLAMSAMAEKVGIEMKSTTGFKRSGGEPFGSNQAVIDAVFEERVLRNNEITDIVEIDANRSAILQVTQHHEAARKSLEEVTDQIRGALKSARAESVIAERSSELQAMLRDGEDINVAAEKVGATVSPAAVISRSDESMDARLLAAMFKAKKPADGQVRIGQAVTQTGDAAVFVLQAIIPGRPESIPLADRDARKQELANQSGNADFAAFLNELQMRAKIVRSEALAQEAENPF